MKRRLHWKRRRASARSVSFASKCISHLVHSSPINDVKFIVTLRRANLSHYHCLVVTFQKPMSGCRLSSMPWSVQLTSPCMPPSFERWFVINFRSEENLPISDYRKTPLISTYVISGLVMAQVHIFGAVLTFRGYDKAEAKILQGRILFDLVLSVDTALLCMFQRLWTYFQDIGVLIFGGGGGYVLSGHCSRQQISVKIEGVLIFGRVLIYGFYGSLLPVLFINLRMSKLSVFLLLMLRNAVDFAQLSQLLSLWEITGISYGNKSRPDAHSHQMGHTLHIRNSWPQNLNEKDDLALLLF